MLIMMIASSRIYSLKHSSFTRAKFVSSGLRYLSFEKSLKHSSFTRAKFVSSGLRYLSFEQFQLQSMRLYHKRPQDGAMAPVEDLETNLWENFNYGSFNIATSATKKQKKFLDVLEADAAMLKDTMDPEWKQLNDEEVERGVVTLEEYVTDERIAKFKNVLSRRTKAARVVFENPANANNCWAALRTFDSFAMQYCDVITDSDVYVNKYRRGTMHQALGAQKWLSLKQWQSTKHCLTHLKGEGYRIAITDIHHEKSIPMNEVDWKAAPTAIVLGNELRGVSDECREHADIHFYFPMKGFAESLNVSAFCAILCNALESNGILDPALDIGKIPERDLRRIYLTWLARTAPGAPQLMRRVGLDVQTDRLYETIAGYTTRPT